VLPDLKMAALTRFTDGSGLFLAGKVFPFCFIHHCLRRDFRLPHAYRQRHDTQAHHPREATRVPSATAPLCLESLVAIMAIIAACTLEPGVYLSMNVKGDAATTVAKVTALGFPVTVEQMDGLAVKSARKTLFGRTGGAPTLAVGMANIFSKLVGGRWLDLWYHFAIMFEALFHPDHGGRRHTRGPLCSSGFSRAPLETAGRHAQPARESVGQRIDGGGLGLFF